MKRYLILILLLISTNAHAFGLWGSSDLFGAGGQLVYIASAELITDPVNRNMSAAGDWSQGIGWATTGGAYQHTGAGAFEYGTLGLAGLTIEIGKYYRGVYTVTVTSGSVVINFGGAVVSPAIATSGTYTFEGYAGNTQLSFIGYAQFEGSIDNVSVVEITKVYR